MTGVGNIWRAVLLALLFCMVASATESIIRIHVGRAGLFSAAGHEHWVSAPTRSVHIWEKPTSGPRGSQRATFRFARHSDGESFRVLSPDYNT